MREKIEKWYRQGLWTAQMVADAVEKGRITAGEYGAITGGEYGA